MTMQAAVCLSVRLSPAATHGLPLREGRRSRESQMANVQLPTPMIGHIPRKGKPWEAVGVNLRKEDAPKMKNRPEGVGHGNLGASGNRTLLVRPPFQGRGLLWYDRLPRASHGATIVIPLQGIGWASWLSPWIGSPQIDHPLSIANRADAQEYGP